MLAKEGECVVTTTVRFPEDLYQQVTDFAKENDLSKNQVIKMAVRQFLQKKSVESRGDHAPSGEASHD